MTDGRTDGHLSTAKTAITHSVARVKTKTPYVSAIILRLFIATSLLEWSGVTCVKWGSVVSRFVELSCGVRQGGVLSPHLFAIYIDSVVKKVSDSEIGCYIKGICISILRYADDILLLAPSVTALQRLLRMCEQELMWLDMSLNVKKISMYTYWSPI